jgi:predicted RNA-binding protein YlqC (UPF0109 family)
VTDDDDAPEELDDVEELDGDDDEDDGVDDVAVHDDSDAADEVDGNRRPAPTAAAVLEYLVRQLVDEPDGVEVEAVDRSRGVQLEVRVAPGDMGRVIGKRGRTAQAIRTVTRAAAAKDSVDVNIEFLE